jgi:hypothetical protein
MEVPSYEVIQFSYNGYNTITKPPRKEKGISRDFGKVGYYGIQL